MTENTTSPSDEKDLTLLLDAACRSLGQAGASPFVVQEAVHRATRLVDNAFDPIASLLRILKGDARYSPFDGRMQPLPGGARRIDLTDLAIWLIQRGVKTSGAQALAEVDQYLNTPSVRLVEAFAIDGVTLDGVLDWGPGVSVVPWNGVQVTGAMARWGPGLMTAFPTPTAAVLLEFDWPTKTYSEGERDEMWPSGRPQLPQDLLFGIGLATGTAPAVLAEWTQVPDNAPIGPSGLAMFGVSGWSVPKKPTAEQVEGAMRIAGQLTAKTPSDRQHLDVALQRLWLAIRGHLPVSRAIDLGIVFESLLLSDLGSERGELSFRLQLRGSRLLASTVPERKAIYTMLRDVYRLRSIAVHSGRLPEKVGSAAADAVLVAGIDLANRMLRRFIDGAPKDWDAIMLG